MSVLFELCLRVSDTIQHHHHNRCISFGTNIIAGVTVFVTAVACVCVCVPCTLCHHHPSVYGIPLIQRATAIQPGCCSVQRSAEAIHS